MTFIVQPKTEGQTMNCPNCDGLLVARLKEYKYFTSKIQWQDKDQTKAHFDKYGGCKGEPASPETPGMAQPGWDLELSTPTPDEYLKNRKTELDQETRDFDDKMQKLIVSAYADDELINIYKDIDRLIALEHVLKSKFTERGIELNVHKIGLYLKLLRGDKS